jgi:zinc/manganese transport system ATP-binding protein
MRMAEGVAVTLENLTLSYARHPALHHVSGCFASGSLTAVAGPNGAGKSTLLKAVAGLIAPDAGTIRMQPARPCFAYLPQAATLQRDFPISLLEMVSLGLWKDSGGFGALGKAAREKALAALEKVGLAGFSARPVFTLSAGQFQRAQFARVLLQDAPLILLDEPFSAVDAQTQSRLLHLIAEWHAQRRTVICVLHDLAQIHAHFPQCLLLARRAIAWGATRDTLTPPHLAAAQQFHEAWQPDAELCEL